VSSKAPGSLRRLTTVIVTGTPDADRSELRRNAGWLLAILGVATAVRLWGLSFGLPNYFSGDEVNKRDVALEPGTPELDAPQPGFLYNALFVVYRTAHAINPGLEIVDYHYLGRLLMVLIGVLTVLAVWMLANELSDTARPGPAISAALLVAVVPLHTAVSRYIKEDAPLGLMVTLVAWALVRYWKSPSMWRLLLLGFLAGVCFSTKFTGAVLFPIVGVAIFAGAVRRRISIAQLGAHVGGVAAAALVGFFLVSPQYLVHPEQLREAFLYQVSYSEQGHDGIPISPWSEWWTYYARNGLIPGLTLPVFLVAIVGAVPLLRRPGGWTITASVLLLYVVMEASPAKPAPFAARYLTPVIPLLCVHAGFGIQAIIRRFQTWGRPVVGGVVCAVVFVIPPTLKSLMIADEAGHDTRLIAGEWMDAHLPAGTRVAIDTGSRDLPVASGWDAGWQVEDREDTLDPLAAGEPAPYFVLSSFKYQRFLDAPQAVPERTKYYRAVMRYRLVKEFRPRWLSYGKHSPVIRIYRPGSAPGAPR
jgi:hypothetical protein